MLQYGLFILIAWTASIGFGVVTDSTAADAPAQNETPDSTYRHEAEKQIQRLMDKTRQLRRRDDSPRDTPDRHPSHVDWRKPLQVARLAERFSQFTTDSHPAETLSAATPPAPHRDVIG
jgi:hypothetical protein